MAEKTTAEHLADFDVEAAAHRDTLDAEDLTSWDLDAAVARAELEEALDEGDADDEGATFSAASVPFDPAAVEFCGPQGDCFLHRGVIFRAGDYEESHGFSMSRAELAAAVRDFRPVKITHGHPKNRGPLDDDLGEVRAVELSADGTELIGTVALPGWLHQKLKDVRRHVSASFDRVTKRLRDVSLVTFPHIPGAELHAAFAAARPAAGRIDVDRYLAMTPAGLRALAARTSDAAEFAAADAPPPAVAAASVDYSGPSDHATRMILDRQPVRVDDAAELALLEACRRLDGPALLRAILGRIAALEGAPQSDARLARSNGIRWAADLAPRGAELARLRAMRDALSVAEPGGSLGYTGPSKAEVLDAHGLLVVHAALRTGDAKLSELLARAGHRRRELGDATPEAGALAASAVTLLRSGVSADAYQDIHKALAREADRRAEAMALAALLDGDGLTSALAKLAKKAIAAAGGGAPVARDYGELLALAPVPIDPNARRLEQIRERLVELNHGDSEEDARERTMYNRQRDDIEEAMRTRGPYVPPAVEPHPDEARRAKAVEAELASVGATATSSDAGRMVKALQAEHATASTAFARRARETHEQTVVAAAKAVEAVLAGELAALENLIAAASRCPDAFTPGLAEALGAVPLEAVRRVPCGGFAHLVL